MTDKEFQLSSLEMIFRDATLAPVFKHNPKYDRQGFAALTPYIAYDDVMEYRYIVRGRPLSVPIDHYDNEKRQVIAEYDTVEALVEDGWRLD